MPQINLLVDQIDAPGIITTRLTLTLINVHRAGTTRVPWQTLAIEPVDQIIALTARHTRIRLALIYIRLTIFTLSNTNRKHFIIHMTPQKKLAWIISLPVKPGGHSHLKLFTPSTHVALF